MNKIFGSLEELDDVTDANDEAEVKDVDLDEIAFKLMEADELVEGAEKDLNSANDKIDELESTVERLEVLASVIKKHGINQAIMEVADPFNELVDAGICCSYEELSIDLSTGVHANTTVVNIDAAIEGLWDKIIDTFKSIGNKMKDHSIKQEKANKIYTTALIDIKKVLDGISNFDTKKFENKSVRAYSNKEMKQAYDAIFSLEKVIDGKAVKDFITNINNLNKNLDKVTHEIIDGEFIKYCDDIFNLTNDKNMLNTLGLSVEKYESKRIKSITMVTPSITDDRDIIKNLGWEITALKHIVADAIVMLDRTYGYSNALSDLSKNYNNEAYVFYQATVNENTPDEHKKLLNIMLIAVNHSFQMQHVIINAGIRILRNVASSTLELARAAVASKA